MTPALFFLPVGFWTYYGAYQDQVLNKQSILISAIGGTFVMAYPIILLKLKGVFDYDFAYRYNVLGVEGMVIDRARQMANRQPLRAYDAVHLATAWLLNEELFRADLSPLTFVCADDRLIAIAQAEGLLTDNPNHHS